MTKLCRLLIVALALSSMSASALAAGPVVVATSLQALYSLTSFLSKGTGIQVESVPKALPGMGQLQRTFVRQNAAIGEQLAKADAVVTISSVWPDDPLYREARSRNIRVVQIDAARSLGKTASSVMLVAQPSSNVPWRRIDPASGDSPYVWFSPSNAIRMAEIVAADLARLAPDDAGTIEANLKTFSQELRALRAEFEAKFLAAQNPEVFILTDHFAYLTGEFGIFIDGALLEDDVRWSAEDYEGLTKLLRDRDIKTVLHHWQPDEKIVDAVQKGGAKLVLLDDGEHSDGSAAAPPDSPSVVGVLRTNLDLLNRAFATQQ